MDKVIASAESAVVPMLGLSPAPSRLHLSFLLALLLVLTSALSLPLLSFATQKKIFNDDDDDDDDNVRKYLTISILIVQNEFSTDCTPT